MKLQHLLRPDWVLTTTLAQMPLQDLLDRGIRALVLDVDRTLLPRRQSEMPLVMESWLRQAKDNLRLHLFSNNPSRRRIGAVAQRLDLPYTTSAGKPRRSALRRVLADLALPPEQVALAGDRLFTDVLVGNRLGLFTVLVKPLGPEGQPCPEDRLQRLEVSLARLVGTEWSR